MTTTVDGRLKALGLTLPDAPAPVANYVPFHIAGNLLFISGQISRAADGSVTTGKLGGRSTWQEAGRPPSCAR